MMSRIAYLAGPIGLAISFAATTAAVAQCRLCDVASSSLNQTEAATPIRLEVESSLRFDRLVLMGAGEGTAVLKPDGTRLLSGSLGDFSGSAMVGTAVIRGEPGRIVRVDLPKVIELHSLSGSQLMIDEITTDLPVAPRLDSNGRLSFRFGGRLHVNGEADGDYRGDLPITADYL
jgi:hypothetical protein